jgi:PAS domain S-box-containing protein
LASVSNDKALSVVVCREVDILQLLMANNDQDNPGNHGRNDAQISAAHERLMGIVGSATDAIITVDNRQQITLFNTAAERMFRCPVAEAIGQSLDRFIPQRFREVHREHIRVFAETGVTTRAMASQRALMALRSDGVEFPVEATISQITVSGQKLFTAIVRDVSERKQAEGALRKSEERYRALFEYAPDGILIADSKSVYIDANPSICQLLGYSRDELIGLHASNIVIQSEVQYIGPALETINAGADYNREWQFRRKDGSVFAAEVIATKMPDGNLMGMVRDVSERKRSEAALRESEGRLGAIVETAVDGIITIDEQGLVTSFNPAAERLFGYASGEVAGKNINLLMPSPYHDEHDGYLSNYRNTGVKKIIGIGREVVGRRKDGTHFPMDLAVSETLLGNRRIFTGIVRDISDRKGAEETQAKLAAIVESSDDAIIGKSLDGIIATWNNGAERLFGYTTAEVVGRHISILIPPERLHEEANIQHRLAQGESIEHFDTVRVTKDGRKIDVSLTVSPIRNSAGTIVGASKIVRDITARKKAEESLARQAEELARSNVELERFAYIASHDLQEPLRSIQSFAQLLQRDCEGKLPGDAAEYLGFITGGVQRMQTLIRDLLSYSRVSSQGGAFGPANCKEIFERILENLRASVESNQASITVEALPVVIGDATQLGQVFQNLLVNAIKFHGKRTPCINVSAREEPGEWVFSVADNGIGIAPKYFDRIFIIFQRLHTIEEYSGTGIGLAVCKKIVERHGGRIWVESVVGEGSTFHFSIPKRGTAT